jgi:hypothetical protein
VDLEALNDWYQPLRYVIPAYALAILLVGGYARSISQRTKVLDLERASFAEEDGDTTVATADGDSR